MHALLPSLCNKQTLTWLLIRHAPAYNYANYDTFAFYVVWPTPLLRLFYACMYVYMFYVHAHVYTCTVYMYVHTCTCININISFRSLNSQLHGMLSQMSQRIPFQFQLKHNCNDIGGIKNYREVLQCILYNQYHTPACAHGPSNEDRLSC